MSNPGFLFPGQGAQAIGMGQKALSESNIARDLFQQANDILGYDLADLCANGPAEKLNSTEVSQPALYVCSLAALEVLKANEPEIVDACTITAGLSLGEYTALVFAGVLLFEDGLRIVKARGEAMQAAADATPSSMASILMLDVDQVEAIVEQAREQDNLIVANYLCPKNYVISGDTNAVERAIGLAEEQSARIVRLSVAGAFHTAIMRPAVEPLKAAIASATFNTPRIPVVSNVDAVPHSDPAEIQDLLAKQVVSPVRWEDSMRYVLGTGVDSLYEIGPGSVLKGLMKRIERKFPVTNVD